MHVCGYVRTHCAHRCRYVCVPKQIGIGGCTCISRHPFSQIYVCVHGHPPIFRHMYFAAASRRACGRAVAADARAGARALGCICLRVQSPLRMHRCVYHGRKHMRRMRVCVRPMRGDFLRLRPVRPHVRPSSRGGRGPHARAVRGRSIGSTKVKALPESLGQCKLLEELCVPLPPPPPPCAFAAVPALRCGAWRCRAGALGPHHAALDAAAAALPVVGRGGAPRAHGWRPRDRRARSGWARAARRGRTVGAQGRVQHRARGAAGGGRVAQPEVPVSAPAAA
jgi:hypothetical protein